MLHVVEPRGHLRENSFVNFRLTFVSVGIVCGTPFVQRPLDIEFAPQIAQRCAELRAGDGCGGEFGEREKWRDKFLPQGFDVSGE